jgi:hypothetical protein
MKYGSDFTPKKRVTKNDKKKKQDVYSQKHIRLTLKQLESKTINAPECESVDREGVCSTKVGGVVRSQTRHANR